MKLNRKSLVLAILGCALGQGAVAGEWNKVLECDRGAVVVDVNAYTHQFAQVVIRDAGIAKYFESLGARGRQSQRGEFIFGGILDGQIFGGRDFKYVANNSEANGFRTAEAYREGGGLKVRVFKYVDPGEGNSDCGRDLNCGSPYWTEAGNWYFRECREF